MARLWLKEVLDMELPGSDDNPVWRVCNRFCDHDLLPPARCFSVIPGTAMISKHLLALFLPQAQNDWCLEGTFCAFHL
jgi:hypothetical protein